MLTGKPNIKYVAFSCGPIVITTWPHNRKTRAALTSACLSLRSAAPGASTSRITLRSRSPAALEVAGQLSMCESQQSVSSAGECQVACLAMRAIYTMHQYRLHSSGIGMCISYKRNSHS